MIENFAIGYFTLAAIKYMLMIVNLPSAIMYYKKRGGSGVLFFFVFCTLGVFVTLVYLMPMLVRERWRFFLIYPKWVVEQQLKAGGL